MGIQCPPSPAIQDSVTRPTTNQATHEDKLILLTREYSWENFVSQTFFPIYYVVLSQMKH